MVGIFCCYDLECKKTPKYWVRRKGKTLPNWWYPLCQEHLKIIILDSEIEITGLKTERVRKFEHKIFCARGLAIKEHKNWSMFIDWEGIADTIKIDIPITFEVYRALQKHYYNNYLKIKRRITEV